MVFYGNDDALEVLLQFTKDPDRRVRAEVMEGLGKVNYRSLVTPKPRKKSTSRSTIKGADLGTESYDQE